MALPHVVARIVNFLRAGYPEGVPQTDYIPLLALLRRRLSDEEVVAVASELAAQGLMPIEAVDIGVAITKITHGAVARPRFQGLGAHEGRIAPMPSSGLRF